MHKPLGWEEIIIFHTNKEAEIMKNPQEVFGEFQKGLELRNFIVKPVLHTGNCFTARSPFFKHKITSIVALLSLNEGTFIFIKKDGLNLDKDVRDAVLSKFGEFFDLTPGGEIFIRIAADLQACRDIEKVTRVVTEAYEMAAKLEK